MFTIRTMAEMNFAQCLELWNRGFSDYYVPMWMEEDVFLGRMALEGLSPRYSVVAMDGDKPVGFTLNGIRKVGDSWTSWNGGTAVIPEYRGKGVGRLLIEASLDIYRRNGVRKATLEAFVQNGSAIRLYERMGYRIRDTLGYLKAEETNGWDTLPSGHGDYEAVRGLARDLSSGSLTDAGLPWQSQWQSQRREGESLRLICGGREAGYALYKRNTDETGKDVSVVLIQCVADREAADDEQREIYAELLRRIFSECPQGVTFHANMVPLSNRILTSMLEELGFRTVIELVYMELELQGEVS